MDTSTVTTSKISEAMRLKKFTLKSFWGRDISSSPDPKTLREKSSRGSLDQIDSAEEQEQEDEDFAQNKDNYSETIRSNSMIYKPSPPIFSEEGWKNLFRKVTINTSPTTTPIGMVIATRPLNLPPQNEQEKMQHLKEYEEMMKNYSKKVSKENQDIERKQQEKLARESHYHDTKYLWQSVILPNWNSYKNTSKVRKLIQRGIPPSLRPKIWPLLIQNKLQITPDLYEIFRAKAKSSKSDSLTLIPLDLPRTFPCLSFFNADGPLSGKLHEILAMYGIYRPDIGYVQGMSFIGAVFLLYIDDPYEAFWCLANILNSHCLMAFYRMDMLIIAKYVKLLNEFMKIEVPEVFAHLYGMEITAEFYIIDWFLTLFSKSLSLDIAGRVWDSYFYYGDIYLFRASVGLLKMLSPILSTGTYEECLQLLTHLPQDLDEKEFFDSVQSIKMSKTKFCQVLKSNELPIPDNIQKQ